MSIIKRFRKKSIGFHKCNTGVHLRAQGAHGLLIINVGVRSLVQIPLWSLKTGPN